MDTPSNNRDDARRLAALEALESAHREDPRSRMYQREALPYSVVYHRRVRAHLRTLEPDPSEVLELAAAAQHIRRWTLPRTAYPEGRTGYKRWRRELTERHIRDASEILKNAEYSAAEISRVGELLRKQKLQQDPEAQTLEDAVCLAFLELEYADFAQKHPPEKIEDILKKTWAKMSERGRQAASALLPELPPDGVKLLRHALRSDATS
jgi:hypothetical protein